MYLEKTNRESIMSIYLLRFISKFSINIFLMKCYDTVLGIIISSCWIWDDFYFLLKNTYLFSKFYVVNIIIYFIHPEDKKKYLKTHLDYKNILKLCSKCPSNYNNSMDAREN